MHDKHNVTEWANLTKETQHLLTIKLIKGKTRSWNSGMDDNIENKADEEQHPPSYFREMVQVVASTNKKDALL